MPKDDLVSKCSSPSHEQTTVLHTKGTLYFLTQEKNLYFIIISFLFFFFFFDTKFLFIKNSSKFWHFECLGHSESLRSFCHGRAKWLHFSNNCCQEISSLIDLVQFICSVVSDSLRPHESQHTRPPCPSPTPGVHSDSHPSSQWCHPAISSSVVPFSSCP